jgi:hypothetical protein
MDAQVPTVLEVPLHRLAHARAGDKGNRLNVSLICYRPRMYPVLVEQVTEHVVLQLFKHRNPTAVRRYLLPKLAAMNFVIDNALEGGVNHSLSLDRHGKALSYLLLSMPVRVPAQLLQDDGPAQTRGETA